MRLTQLSITNYKGLRDVTIPLSRFGCLIGENNSGKSSFLQALSLFFSGSKLAGSYFFDDSKPIRIAVTFDDISGADLARLAEEHRTRVAGIVKNGRLVLVRIYSTDGKNALFYNSLTPVDARFSVENIAALLKGQRAGQAFVDRLVQAFPEIKDIVNTTMNQEPVKQILQELADSLPDDQKAAADQPLPTGIDKSIEPMLPNPIYIPAVKDLADDIKTAESTPFGKILAILLPAVEAKLPEAQKLFEELNSKLNRVQQPDGSFVDGRLDEVKLIESTVEKYVRESFSDVALRITIPPPELKTVFSSAHIYLNDGVDGLIDSKGDASRNRLLNSPILRGTQSETRACPCSC
jgi:putative ATP-dependent endonuclease of OLD family